MTAISRKGAAGESNKNKKQYFSSLWPIILHRILNKMKFPNNRLLGGNNYVSTNSDVKTSYTNAVPIRKASVVYFLMVYGVAMDCIN